MEKSSSSCPWGDCPDLDHGPKSREHDGRFTKQRQPESQMMKTNTATMINGNNAQNSAK